MFVKAEPYLKLNRASIMELLCKKRDFFRFKGVKLFFEKNFIIDVRLGSKYASDKTETFKMKLRSAKSLQLLERAAFLVVFYKLLLL